MRLFIKQKIDLLDWLVSQGKIDPNGRGFKEKSVSDLILNKRLMMDSLVRDIVYYPTCHIESCKSCCYFNPVSAVGVPIETRLVDKVFEFASSNGLNNPLRKVRADSIDSTLFEKLNENDDFFLEDDEGSFVYCTTVDPGQFLPYAMCDDIPIPKAGEKLWTSKDSTACIFLDDGDCILFKAGLQPKICRMYLCKTGNTVNILSYLGLVDREDLGTMPLSIINELSDRLNEVFTVEVLDLDMSYESKLKAIVKKHVDGKDILQADLDELSSIQLNILELLKQNLARLLKKIV